MSVGASRFYKLLAWFHRQGKQCFMSLKKLAEKLLVSMTTVKRWTRELASLGYITKQRCGPHPNVYVVSAENGPSLVCLPGEHKSLGSSELVNTKTMLALPIPEPKSKPRWSNTEREAVCQSIAQFRYSSGENVKPEAFLGRLERIAAFYSASGHRVAAEFDHVYERVRRSPSTAPEFSNWFMAVLEARLKRSVGGSKSVQSERKPLDQRVVAGTNSTECEPNLVSAARFLGWSEQELKALELELSDFSGQLETEAATILPQPAVSSGKSSTSKSNDGRAACEGLVTEASVALPEPVAQSPALNRTTDPEEREWCDTGAWIRELAGVKALEYRPAPATMEEIYQALNKRAS